MMMKLKFFFVILFLNHLYFAQIQENGYVNLRLSYGIFDLFKTDFEISYVRGNTFDSLYVEKGINPIILDVEYMYNDVLGFSFNCDYSHVSYSYLYQSLTYNYIIDNYDYAYYPERCTGGHITGSLAANFRFMEYFGLSNRIGNLNTDSENKTESFKLKEHIGFDPFISLGIGYRKIWYRFETTSPKPYEPLSQIYTLKPIRGILGIGANLLFTENFGVNVVALFGNSCLLKAGITYRFNSTN